MKIDWTNLEKYWNMLIQAIYKLIYRLTNGAYGYEDGNYVEGEDFPRTTAAAATESENE